MSPSECPVSNCSMRSLTLAAITFLGGLCLGGRGKGSDVAGFVRGVVAAHGVNPPFLNGLAVFANKHALALAHASGGGKCKRRVPYPRNGVARERSEPEVCTSEARKIRVPLARARGGASQEGLVSLLGAERRRSHFVVAVAMGRALRAGTRLLRNCLQSQINRRFFR